MADDAGGPSYEDCWPGHGRELPQDIVHTSSDGGLSREWPRDDVTTYRPLSAVECDAREPARALARLIRDHLGPGRTTGDFPSLYRVIWEQIALLIERERGGR